MPGALRSWDLVTQVVPDQNLLATATETARKLAAKPAGALQASKRLMKQPFREQIKAAMKAENEEFSAQVRSEDAKEALTAFLEKRPPACGVPADDARANSLGRARSILPRASSGCWRSDGEALDLS